MGWGGRGLSEEVRRKGEGLSEEHIAYSGMQKLSKDCLKLRACGNAHLCVAAAFLFDGHSNPHPPHPPHQKHDGNL